MDNPFEILSSVTLHDTDSNPLIAPITTFERWLLLTTVPRQMQMSDGEALDYAESLGFIPEMF